MLLNQADSLSLFFRTRASRVKMAGIFAMMAILPASGSASPSARISENPTVLTFAQLAACPVTGLIFNNAGDSITPLPENIRTLTGKSVQVTGYMLPLVMENGRARELLLMRNTMGCCYGQSPTANEYLVIRTSAPGLPVTMDIPVALQGTLRVAPVVMGGTVVEFYHLENAVLASR